MSLPRSLLVAVVFAATAAPSLAAGPNDVLPDAPAKATIVRACTMCHQAPFIVAKRRDGAQWVEVVAAMADRGAPVSLDEQAAVAAYLARYFGPRPAPAAGR